MPFFFDPAFDARITPIRVKDGRVTEAEALALRSVEGGIEAEGLAEVRYGDYISHKVAACFPHLFVDSGAKDVLAEQMRRIKEASSAGSRTSSA